MRFALLRPFGHTLRNRFLPKGRLPLRTLLVMSLGAVVCLALYLISVRVVGYFHRQNELGIILSLKIFQMAWLIMFAMLVFSCMVTSVSTLFLSRDNEIIFAAPVRPDQIYFMRYLTTTIYTSWMMAVFSLPVFGAFGTVFAAGPLYWLFLAACVLSTTFIASGLGMALTVVLVKFFPARRTKDIVFYLSLCFGLFIYIVFRMIRPENLVNPDQYGHFVEYLSSISRPAGPYVPAAWAANLLSLYLVDRQVDWLLLSLLILAVPSLFFLGEWAMVRYFGVAYSKSQESFGGYRAFGRRGKYRPGTARWIFKKESKTFLRDSAEWSQLFMIAALVIVYLYSFKALPLDRAPIRTEYIANLISFLNVSLTGFMITSLAARFVFPAVGGETSAFWLITSSPLTVNRFLFYKYLFYVVPFTALSLLLVITSDSLLQISGPMWWFSVTASTVICWAVVAMAIGFGAMYADFKAENRAAAQGSMGALLYLFWAMSLVLTIVFSGAVPMYRITRRWLAGRELDMAVLAPLGWWLLFTLLLAALFSLVSWRKGCRSLDR